MSHNELDIVFVNPPFWGSSESPLYGCLWMSSYLRDLGYAVDYVDGEVLNVDHRQLARVVAGKKPRVVGVSATSLNINSAERLIAELKKQTDATIVLGGVHVTAIEGAESFGSDIVVLGEGFVPMKHILEGSRDPIRHGSAVDLDGLPLPAWDLVDLYDYLGNFPRLAKPSTTTFTSIGCPHRCSFCSLIYKTPRFRNPGIVCDELELLEKKGAREVFFYDDEFNLNRRHAHAVCSGIIDRGLNERLSFKCQVRSSRRNTTEDLLRHMKEAGFTILMWGLESGSQRVLDEGIKKNLLVEDSEWCLRTAHEIGLINFGFLMVQNIGETWEDVLQTASFLKRGKSYLPYSQVTIATPYPGSELHDRAVGGGWIKNPQTIKDTYHPLMDTPWMTAEEALKAKDLLDSILKGRIWMLRRRVRRWLRKYES